MHTKLCICAEIPRLKTATRVVLIVHAYEIRKPSNTGRLAVECLENSEMHIRGRPGEPVTLDSLNDPDRIPVVLYPAPGAQVLTPAYVAALGKPLTLVVPDGNWRQAARMPKREPALRDLPRVILPLGDLTTYRLRNEPKLPHGLATMEAIARALGALEGPAVEEELMRVFRIMVERTLWTKGKMAPEDVFGGFPTDPLTVFRLPL